MQLVDQTRVEQLAGEVGTTHDRLGAYARRHGRPLDGGPDPPVTNVTESRSLRFGGDHRRRVGDDDDRHLELVGVGVAVGSTVRVERTRAARGVLIAHEP
ncbi:hypothetical protein [Geodermatophilus maliterrae]|uniref:Uncharacterized protein n=1 Tax=Geodermatophilus maliterrae TaxID=3162531 RepID=A0ABV3X8C5_9ACTN